MRWMKLEPIIQIEVSKKEKHQYSILESCGTYTQWNIIQTLKRIHLNLF